MRWCVLNIANEEVKWVSLVDDWWLVLLLPDPNEMTETNEMKMQKDDVMKYVLKDEILENERMNESEG